ncbi:MAG: BTAD domain-containing putative transcriptional regulator, partial [Longimicrobiales bacterium]
LRPSMIRFRTLGVLDLRAGDGAELRSVHRQSKRLAVLAYLALAAPAGFQRRDRLLAMFWPELDRDRARHALSQAIHYLRRSLGLGVLVSRGEEIGIAPATLWCDAIAFRQAMERGDLEDALELYAGELLPGLYVSDAPDFERWLEEERSDLAKRAAAIAWRLAERKGASGDGVAATFWARRAVALAPMDEAGLRRLVALLDALGDRAGAIEAYTDFARRLEAEYEVEPSAETRELIDAVKRRAEAGDAAPPQVILERNGPERSDSPVAPVGVVGPVDASVRAETAANPERPQRLPGQRRRRIGWWTLGLAGAALLALVVQQWRDRPAPGVAARDGVAVLYFHDQTGGGRYDYLSDALTTELIRQLHHEGKIEVISAQGVRQFRGRDVPIETVARVLEVDFVVGGSVTQAGDELQVYVELTDASDGRIIDRTVVQRSTTQLFGLVADVSREVVGFLRPALGQEIRISRWRAGTESQEAWPLLKQADGLLHGAMDAERDGDVQYARKMLEQADALLAKAARLDPEWPEPLVLRGWLAERRGWLCLYANEPKAIPGWLGRAEDFASRALALEPQNARALELRGTIRQRQWLLATPEGAAADSLLAAAEGDLRAAVALDPALPRASSILSAVLYSQGRFRESKLSAERAYEVDAYLTDASDILVRLFSASFQLHDDVEAGRWCNEVARRMPDRWAQAYCELILYGWSEDAPADARGARLTFATFGSADAPRMREMQKPMLAMLLAASLARAGMVEGARALIAQARHDGAGNVDLLEFEAAALAAVGDYDHAAQVLARYLELQPTARARILKSRYFEDMPHRLAGGDSR